MVSKDNRSLHDDMYTSKKQRFTIKKLTVGVTSVLLGVAFAGTTASANTDNAASNADNNDATEQTDHTLVLNNTNNETLKTATAANNTQNAQAAVVNPTGDIKTNVADEYQQAVNQNVNAAVQNNDTQTFNIKDAAGQNDTNTLNANNIDYSNVANSLQTMAAQYGSSFVQVPSSNGNTSLTTNNSDDSNTTTQSTITTGPDVNEKIITVTNWNELQDALNSNQYNQIRVQGTVTANTDITFSSSQNIIIEGTNLNNKNNGGATGIGTINFGNHVLKATGAGVKLTFSNLDLASTSSTGGVDLSSTTGQSIVTFNNVNATGSSLFNGGGNTTVVVDGSVTSNVDSTAAAGWQTLSSTKNGKTISDDSRERCSPNIGAANLVVNNGANLTLTRSVKGDTVELNDGGKVTIGDLAHFNATLSGQAYSDAAVRVTNNGSFVTGHDSVVDINAPKARGLVLGQVRAWGANDASTNAHMNSYTEYGLYQGTDNNLLLGKDSTFTFNGRDGVLMGNHATFNSGEGSHVTFNNKGDGVAFDMGNNAKLEIASHSIVHLNSDGKSTGGAGDWAHGNYVGLDEVADFDVDHDGELYINMKNRGGSLHYNDVVNLDTRNPKNTANVYVGNNAVLSIIDDAKDYYGELISTPLGAPNSNFIFDNVRYVNLQKNSVITGHSNNPNLIFMAGSKGLLKGQGLYKVYQWNKKNFNSVDTQYDSTNTSSNYYENFEDQLQSLADNTWTGITSFQEPWSEFNPSSITSTDVNGDVNKVSNKGNSFRDSNNGFNPNTSQRLVIMSMAIPSQETTSDKTPIPYQTVYRYNKDLKAGQTVVTQNGVDGYTEHTTTTYYLTTTDDNGNVVKKIDTSKGTNGISHSESTVNAQNKIVEYGPQVAEVQYVDENGNQIEGTTPYYLTGKIGDTIAQSKSTIDEDGFNKETNQTYSTQETINALEDKGYTLVSDGFTNNNETFDSTMDLAADGNTVSPSQILKVVLTQIQAATLNFVDDDDPAANIHSALDITGKSGEGINFNDAQSIVNTLEGQHYVFSGVTGDGVTGSGTEYANFNLPDFDEDSSTNQTFTVHFRHATKNITPGTPDPDHGYKATDLQKTITRTINYHGDGINMPSITQTATFTGTGTLDEVTNKLVELDDNGHIIQNKAGHITWTYTASDQGQEHQGNGDQVVLSGVATNVPAGYKVTSITPDSQSDGHGNVISDSISINDNDSTVDVYLAPAVNQTAQLNFVDDTTGQEIPGYNAIADSGDAGTGISFANAADQVSALTNAGYVFTNVTGDDGNELTHTSFNDANFGNFDNDTNTTQTFTVHFNHGVEAKNYQGQAIRHIVYKVNNSNTNANPADLAMMSTVDPSITNQDQTVNFTATGYVDKVTGKLVTTKTVNGQQVADQQMNESDLTWKASGNFAEVNSPSAAGYTVDRTSVAAANASYGAAPITEYVVYSPVQVQDQTIQVHYVDDSTIGHQDLSGYDATITAKPGANFNYSTGITKTALEGQGYKIVSDGFSDANLNGVMPDQGGTYYVHVTHATRPVNPSNPGNRDGLRATDLQKTVTRTVNYVDANNSPVASSVTQTANFTANGTIDEVTGQLVTVDADGNITGAGSLTWSADQDLADVPAQSVRNMHVNHVDNDATDTVNNTTGEVSTKNVSHDSANSVVTVHYAANGTHQTTEGSIPTSMTVHFEDENGDKLADDNVQNDFTFTYDGDTVYDGTNDLVSRGSGWNDQLHTYDSVAVPVINGYVAEVKNVAGLDVTQKQPNREVTVVYHKIGNIVPQDKNGNPITNPSTGNTEPNKPYVNDPSDPTKVIPGETVPNIPGYQPSVNTVTPTDPTQDTPVVYDNTQNAVVNYVDADENNRQVATSGALSGASDSQINYSTAETLAALEKEGYVLVNNGFDANGTAPNYDEDFGTTQTYTVTLKHGEKTVTPSNPDPDHGFKTEDLTKTGTQTIHYVGAGAQTPNDNTQTVQFNHSLTIDAVNGHVIKDNGWTVAGGTTTSHAYSAVATPTIAGYTASQTSAGGDTVSVDPTTGVGDINRYVTVTYSPVAPEVDQQAVVTYVDDTTGETLHTDNLSGKAGTNSDYRTGNTIKGYTDSGYELVSDDYPAEGVTFDNDTNTTQSYTVHFVHGTTDVNKDHPKDGIDPTEYTRDVTSTVTYTGAGDQTPAANVQNASWNRTITVDNVTGQVKSATPWTSDKTSYNKVATPVVNGYTSDKANVPDKAVTMDNLTETVNYRPNGHVIPVDQSGNPIPGADQPQYGNDSTDPTKITPTTNTPTVPGYRVVPGQPTVNPDGTVKNPTGNPTGDTTVVYTNAQNAVVNYVDQDANNAVITTSGDLTGASGSQINYSSVNELSRLEDEGYELVSNGYDPDGTAPSFDDNFDQGQTFTITLKHKHETVNPKNPDEKHGFTKDSLQKTGTQTVIYNSTDPDFPAQATNTSHLTFDHEVVIDQVNGDVLEDHGWTPAQSYQTIQSPKVNGYTADKTKVGGEKISANDTDLNRTYVVNYTKNVTPDVQEQQAVVNYIDATEGKTLQTQNLSGKAGTTDSYRTQPTIDDYLNQGYELVSNDYPAGGVTYTDDYGKTQSFNVVLRHASQTVTPNDPNPVTPGDPINPSDPNPNKPTWPNDVQRDNLVKDATQTITYQYSDGSQPSTTHVDTAKDAFTRTVTVDKVTGKVTGTTPWSGTHAFNNVSTPVVEGYHADKGIAGGKTATVGNENVTDTVTYSPNGKIIPVDQNGTPIPNAPTPTYTTTPSDPTSVTPNEQVPSIPGYHPVTPTVTPSNPGTDTPVQYVRDQGTITVQYVDQSNNGALLQTDSVKGNYNDPITYSTAGAIQNFTNKGYELVSDGFTQNGQAFSDANNNQVYQVVLRHKTTPITPQTPGTPGTPINPTDPEGPKYPDSTSPANLTKTITRTINYVNAATGQPVHDPVTQQVTFTANGVLDNVTGQYVTVDAQGNITGAGQLTWAGDGNLGAVQSPQVSGMRISYVSRDDGGNGNVGATTLTHNDSNYDVTVNYVQDGQTTVNGQTKTLTQTVTFVDENGNTLRPAVTENSTVTRSADTIDQSTGETIKEGSWDNESHTFGTVNAPVIPGYVATAPSAGGKTATIDNPSVTDQIVYNKIGNIVPVGPDGKTPLPNVPSKPYTNDPSDPTKVTPGEQVPDIPGYIPSTPTVDPQDPTKDTPVVYTQVENANLTIVDRDNNNQQINVPGITTHFTTSGEQGKTISFDGSDDAIAGLEAQGYKFVSSDFHDGDQFDDDANTDQHFTIVMAHNTTPVDPDHPGAGYSATDLQKTVTRTINYLDSQGNPMPGHSAVTDSFTFTASGHVDKVTGHLVNVDENGNVTGDADGLTWNATSHDFGAVVSPTITGQKVVNVTPGTYADGTNVSTTHVTNQSGNVVVNVYYAPNATQTEGGQTVTHTQTVTFVDDNGNALRTPDVQTSTFTETPQVTDPDGTVHQSTWENDGQFTYGDVTVPMIPGYVVETGTPHVVGGSTVNHDDADVNIQVTYHHVGKIVPVDQHGNPIPGAPTPDYPNDPTDPTTVRPNEPIPSVPGYTPKTPGQTVTPTDPTKDTKVVYTNVQNATVNYVDLDSNNAVIETSGNLTGDPNTAINYSSADHIKALEDKGYVLVNNGYDANGAPDFDDNLDSNQTFTITFRHGTSPVDPQHPGAGYDSTALQKDVTRTVHFVNGQTGANVGDPVEQTVHFTANGNVDRVTGHLVSLDDKGNISGPGQLTWSADQSVDGVKSPAIPGMHVSYVSQDANGTNVAGAQLNHNTNSYDVSVIYTPDGTTTVNGQTIPSTQTIHFVDDQGNTIHDDNVQSTEFTRTPDTVDTDTNETTTTGSWNETSHTFGTINVPAIPGYVADVKTAGGQTTNLSNPNVTVTVTYHRVGKIVPVDPSGKPIPNAPTPDYPNDPSDPTAVTPNEPVPTIPGYTPQVPSVTPETPTNDTEVVYVPVTPTAQTQHAVVNYIDSDNGGSLLQTSGDLTGEAGSTINYSTADTLNNLEDRGYELVNDGFPAGATFDSDNNTTQTYTVVLRHGIQPVNPQNPGNPGQPVNPNDPDGPKYPSDSGQVKKDVTRTITYVDGNGNTIHDAVTQTVHFTAEGEIDKVTGQWKTPLKWSSDQTVNGQETPRIDGYHVVSVSRDGDGNNVKAATLTHETGNYTVTVTYQANGHIIPVDPSGNPIPNVNHPQYPTDPSDPSKVTPDEQVPTIPGYTPSVPTVTPQNPGVDTPVTYTPTTPVTPVTPATQAQQAVVQYIDQDNGNAVIEQSGNLTGNAGSQINYSTAATIQALENRGYELVSDGFPVGAVFDNDDQANQVFTVTLKHGHQTITPNDPTPVNPGDPVNPNNPTGPKYPSDVAHDNLVQDGTQTITYHYSDGRPSTTHVDTAKGAFTRTVTIDKVTGQVTEISAWTGTHKFGNVDTPVVNGYHADKQTAGGKTATPATPNVADDVTYTLNGKIVPQDPEGNPIPGAPTPTYPTDPSDPTKVIPDEPVPTIPGYTPLTPTVTPTDPGTDTPVTYTHDTVTPASDAAVTASVTYVDDTTGATLHTDNLSGKKGETSDYRTTDMINHFTDQGYKLVSNNYPADGAQFENDGATYSVHFVHTTTTFNPQNPGTPGTPLNPGNPDGPKVTNADVNYSQDVTKTVHYVGAGNNTPADNVQQATWTRTITVDNVTGEITNTSDWKPSQTTYGEVNTPVVNGYHADRTQVPSSTVTMSNQIETVNYSANGHIVPVDPSGNPIPGVDHPQYPTDPSDPTKVTPDEPTPTIPGYTPSTPTVTPSDPSNDTPVVYTPVVNEGTITVNYVDTITGKVVHSDTITGNYGSNITYTTQGEIDNLTNDGYELVSDEFTNNAGSEFGESNDGHTYTVALKHGTVVNPQGNSKVVSQKTTTLTVHYVGAGNHNPADNVQTMNWTRYVTVDSVTGDVINTTPWTPDQTDYNAVKTPVVAGYHADKAEVPALQAHETDDEVIVTYASNGHIVPVDQEGNPIPGVDHPQYRTDPNDPTKVLGNEPVPTINGYTPSVDTVTPTNPGTDTPVVYNVTPASQGENNTPAQPAASETAQDTVSSTPEQSVQAGEKQEAKRLPQTGNDDSKNAAELGALGLTAGMMGLAAGKKRRKKEDDNK